MPHTPAAPDLAHTRTRPVHWAATAVALAAVVTAAALVQPERASGTPTMGAPAAPAAPSPAAPASAPDPAGVAFPLTCPGVGQLVTATAQGDLDGDGRPETVVAVRCDAASGTPPHAVYVLTADPAPGGPPRVVATLLESGLRKSVTDLAIRDHTVTATLLGYSSPAVPRSAPDLHQRSKWRWTGGKFSQELTDSAAKRV
ncbi:hypothetical protein [Streptomyces sp. G-G2]|uniref:hypothetical protein n=1 Tax=Streptomyces sp. G-G2 TaxID=3046201 RepID=UPI0024BBE8A3|nr:hypothetical protein [Streptomyces sp. G-G2]MDJ0381619.1 hypothetical protein [Streptomyces sp. G-G2]